MSSFSQKPGMSSESSITGFSGSEMSYDFSPKRPVTSITERLLPYSRKLIDVAPAVLTAGLAEDDRVVLADLGGGSRIRRVGLLRLFVCDARVRMS